jgi:anthranilate phosphoribosyltransferase
MDIKSALATVVEHIDLSTEQMQAVMREIMTGQCTDAQIGGFLIALRMKSESLDEIEGAAAVMRELATPVRVQAPHLVDIVGTGGDGANIFNVSTAAAFVAAAAGCHVAKHGNRAVSSRSGSADLLEAAGVRLDLRPEQVAQAIEQVGVGFMFAVAHHGAMKHAIGARKELGLRTIFNILGPMTNPAGVERQLIGVFNGALCRPMAEVMARLGSKHVMVVHAEDGLDEISLATPTHVAELKDGAVREYVLLPEDLGVESQSLIGLGVEDAQDSLALIRSALSGQTQEKRAAKAAAMLALNAGAAIYVAGLAASPAEGVAKAKQVLASGAAAQRLQALVDFSAAAAA